MGGGEGGDNRLNHTWPNGEGRGRVVVQKLGHVGDLLRRLLAVHVHFRVLEDIRRKLKSNKKTLRA